MTSADAERVRMLTERLELRPFEPGDEEAMGAVFADAEALRFWGPPLDAKAIRRRIESSRQRQLRDGFARWAIVVRASGELVGDAGLTVTNVEGTDEVELGWVVRRDQWGLGIASEAAAAWRDRAFGHLGLDRIVSMIRAENVPSRRVAEKLGMHVEREAFWNETPHLMYVIERSRRRGHAGIVRVAGTLPAMRTDTGFAPITTERLVLRRSRPEDAERIASYRSDPDVLRFQGWDRTDAEGIRAEIVEMSRRVPGEPGWVQLSVEERASGELVGDVGLSPAAGEPGVVKLGYTIAPEFQRRGYATEAVRALVDYVFDVLGADLVRIYADGDNVASHRVAEKSGLRLLERFRHEEDGESWFGVRYELSRAERASAARARDR